MLQGCGTAIITPFLDDGHIDEQGLRDIVAYQEEQGVDMIIACGSTGESATLDHKEHIRVIEIVVDAAKRAKVVAGTGSNATHEAIYLSKEAQNVGAHAMLSVSPYYNKPTPQGIIMHFEAIARAVDIPIIIYNIPGRTGSNITASTMLKLATIPGIAGVKEASGDLGQMMDIIAKAPKDFSVLAGDDAMTFPLMALGGNGVISVASNLVPGRMKALVDLMTSGQVAEAKQIHYELLPLFHAIFLETNPIPIKTAMRMVGRPAGPFRLPLCDMTPHNRDALMKVLQDLKIL